MEIEHGAREIANRLPYGPHLVQRVKEAMDWNYGQFKDLPDWQKWRLVEAWARVASSSGEDLVAVSKKEWALRTNVTNRILKMTSQGVPPDAVLAYRGLLWDFLNKGEFSSDPVLEDKIRQHLRCWDEWAEESRKELDLLDRSNRWYFWFPIPIGPVMTLYAIFVLGKRTKRAYTFLEIAQFQLENYRKDKEPHEASVRASRVLMDYLREVHERP